MSIIEEFSNVISAVLILIISIIIFLVTHYVIKKLLAHKHIKYWQTFLLQAVNQPIKILIITIAFTILIDISQPQISEIVDDIQTIIFISIITWVTLAFIKKLEKYFLKSNGFSSHKNKEAKRSSIVLMMKLCFVTTLIISMIVTLQTIGVKVQAIVTFISLGGVTLGIASRDLTAGVFGTMMLYSNRNFLIGDRIKLNTFEGEVEEITWLSTKIRLDNKKLLYIPNIQFLTHAVENISKSTGRKLLMYVDVFYTDIVAIQTILNDILVEIQSLQKQYNHINTINSSSFEIKGFQDIKVLAKYSIYFDNKITQSELNSKKQDIAIVVSTILRQYYIKFNVAFEE